jgi:DNA (cytosine-5)-methyltransferase 1
MTDTARTVRPRLLDVCCKQGGASAGYAAAGFEVYGIDRQNQPRYPYTFHRMDLRDLHPRTLCLDFDALHFSPPCQSHSNAQRIQGREHEDFIAECREIGDGSGLPYVIENVEGAPLRDPVTLCGAMFGLRTYRHRLWEPGGGFELPHCLHSRHLVPVAKMGRPPLDGEFIHAVGNFSGVELVRRDWDVPWMSRDGIREAIPPRYAEFVGRQLLAHVAASRAS